MINVLLAFAAGVAVTFVAAVMAFRMTLGWLEETGHYRPPHQKEIE